MYRWCFLAFIFLFTGCAANKKMNHPATEKSSGLIVDGKIWSSIFQQKAAEYKALCLQAFNIARVRIDESLRTTSQKPRAIITDIDETFLDNSPYAIHQALQGKDYEPATWAEWTAKGIADTLTGALSFFNYAAQQGIEIFYITNREESERKGTLQNLQHFNFPFADNNHLILKQAVSSKEPRRQAIAKNYDIILLLGDNLADMSAAFDKKSATERNQQVQLLSAEFGKKFIVLPNFNYGGWEDAIYLNSRNWTPLQKDSLLKTGLKNY